MNIQLPCLLSLSLASAQSVNPYYPSPLLSSHSVWRLGGADFLPEDSVTAVGLKQQLIRRYHYLEYIKSVYKQLKEEYTRYFVVNMNFYLTDKKVLDSRSWYKVQVISTKWIQSNASYSGSLKDP